LSRKKILIICYSHHSKEPRLLMQCAALKTNFEITTAGFSAVNNGSIGFIQLTNEKREALISFHKQLPFFLRLPFSLINHLQGKWRDWFISDSSADYKKLKDLKFDLIICHHPSTLVMAMKLKKRYKSRLIFNAHEIYPLEFEDDPEWMKNNSEAIDNLLKSYLGKCDQVFTVNPEICDFYFNRYKVKCLPIHNSKPFNDLEASPVKNPMKIIHHGGAMPQRKLEQMAEAVLACGNKFELTFMLVNTNPEYLRFLKEKYEPRGIKFVEPVAYDQIIKSINKFDIGLYILPADNLNHHLALPNKLFEFIQAKLAIVCSPNPAMKNLVLTNGVGIVSKGFEVQDMVELLTSLKAETVMDLKKNSQEVAAKLSSKVDEERILSTVNALLN